MSNVELVLGMTLDKSQAVVLSGVEAAKHKLVVGVTGAGKSKFLAGLAVQLLNEDVGFVLLDAAGDLCDDVLRMLLETGFYADERSLARLAYLDFTRPDRFVPFNVLSQPYPPHQVAASVLEAVKRSWSSLAGGSAPVLENLVLYGSFVLAVNHLPLTKLGSLLTNASYRRELLRNVSDEGTQEFFARFAETGRRNSLLSESTLRRISLLTFHPALRNSLGQLKNVLQMRQLMDHNISVLVNLGGLDPETQSFLGCLVSTAVEEAALSRANVPESRRTPYHFIMDEFSQFSARSATGLERVLSLTRKYGLSLTLGCQVFGQIPTELRATLGQTTFIGFRLSRQDATWGAELVTSVDRERVKYTATGHRAYMSPSEQRGEWEDILSSLPPRHAVLRVGDETIQFQTLGIPGNGVSQAALQQVKAHYAARYLTAGAQLAAPKTNKTHDTTSVGKTGTGQGSRSRVRRIVPLNNDDNQD